MPPFIQQHRNICPQLHNIAVFGLDASADQFQHGAGSNPASATKFGHGARILRAFIQRFHSSLFKLPGSASVGSGLF